MPIICRTYELDFPPSVNMYWRRKGSIYFIGSKGKKFRKSVDLKIKECNSLNPSWSRLLTGNLAAVIELAPSDDKIRDIDNYHKASLDALKHAKVYKDDSQIKTALTVWYPKDPFGYCRITLVQMPRLTKDGAKFVTNSFIDFLVIKLGGPSDVE